MQKGGKVPKKIQTSAPEPPRGRFIVNPAGAVHEVTEAHAAERLAQDLRYRAASADEIAAYEAASGYQTHERPLAAPFSR